MKTATETMYCDVLVIGGGETGIRAAVEAKRSGAQQVLLVTKGKFGAAGVMFSEITYGWDMQAATGQNDPSDNKEVHLQDIMNAAQGTCSKKLARILTEEAPSRLQDLQNYFGLELYKNPDGTGRQVYGCFSTRNRGYQFVHPEEIKRKMADSINKFGVNLIEGLMITEILKDDTAVCGALGIRQDGSILEIHSSAVILAAGGATGMFKHNFASSGMCGDGYSLALRAGCKLTNMEFMQFGLGLLAPRYRALFLDRLMYLQPKVSFNYEHNFPCSVQDMMTVHSQHFPFSTIDESSIFDVAVFKETVANGGKGVEVDLSVIPLKKLEEIPVWGLYYNYFGEENNPYENKLAITCFAHACNGGVMIDDNAFSGVQGLYAAGEMVTGPHGANRLGGNMHAACQVFGTRAGRNAAAYAAKHGTDAGRTAAVLPEKTCDHAAVDYQAQKALIADALWANVNVARNEMGLRAALAVVKQGQRIRDDGVPGERALWDYYELRSTVLASEAIISSALERRETRGSHNREDYPQLDQQPYLVQCSLSDGRLMARRITGYEE